MSQNRRSAVFAAALALTVLVGGCAVSSDPELADTNDYVSHEPLRVAGYPSAATLAVVQKAVWRLADGDAGRLAALATSDGSKTQALANAKLWVSAFGKDARGKVTAEFLGAADERQTVVVYFQDSGRRKDLHLRVDGIGGEDGWRIRMNDTDPASAVAEPTWAPRTPGTGELPPG
ncbi:hypothetical protein [Kitasatospora sp. DSM 101779]|uniref:hypothetical protein n=1 Tax=Kitasatospora sp. DSM 101779 TaxID=2853165 RepID=UPI0021D98D1B|nr:hypothetical protein [Kitasatospora sp. DSM 101779]MCU7822082.1 hypothetical protein [Kitasatospora sp. DSM 101779]